MWMAPLSKNKIAKCTENRAVGGGGLTPSARSYTRLSYLASPQTSANSCRKQSATIGNTETAATSPNQSLDEKDKDINP